LVFHQKLSPLMERNNYWLWIRVLAYLLISM